MRLYLPGFKRKFSLLFHVHLESESIRRAPPGSFVRRVEPALQKSMFNLKMELFEVEVLMRLGGDYLK